MFAKTLLLLSLASCALPGRRIAPTIDDYCQKKSWNTPCKYKCVRNDTACGEDQTYKYRHLSAVDLRFALHRHNVLRDLVAGGAYLKHSLPAASNMMVMSWDKQCEWLTACYVLQCTRRGHDAARLPVGQKGGQGQNLFRVSSSDLKIQPVQRDINASIKSWFNEYKQLTPDYVDTILNKGFRGPKGNKMIGHLTQMIWADTAFVGCAQYKYVTKSGNINIFCNYNPAGNVAKAKMYLEGPPASKCPPGTKRNVIYRNLCGRIRRRKEDLFVPPVDLDPEGTKNRVQEEEEEALQQDKDEKVAAAKGGAEGLCAGVFGAVVAVLCKFL